MGHASAVAEPTASRSGASRSPILFQGTKIGDVHLGILEEPLSRVARLILTLLGILTLVTIGTVVLGVYLLARRLARPIRTLKSGLDEIAAGRYDFRIADKRTDEFGELFRAYDRTASALEARYDRPGAPAIPPGEGTIVVAGPAAAGAHLATVASETLSPSVGTTMSVMTAPNLPTWGRD